MGDPRFVILHHTQPAAAEHWDLMLQTGDHLATWRLACLPLTRRRAKRDRRVATGGLRPQRVKGLPGPDHAALLQAQRIADHRIEYLSYEGPLSRDRGHVRRVDEGIYRLLGADDTHWVVAFTGRVLRGTWRLPSAR
jgi:hypothetical protein